MRKLFLFVLPFITVTAFAQPDLETCKEMARRNYPLIRQYDLISQSRSYSFANASRSWLPQIGLVAQATYQSDVVKWPEQFESMLVAQGMDVPGLRKDQYKVQIDIQQTIWDGGKSRIDRKIADGEAEQDRMSTEVDMYALDERIEDIYFGILLMQEQERQIEDMLLRLKNNLGYVRALVESGVAMQSDADAVEVQILSANQNLQKCQSGHLSFRRMLSLFIGEDVGEDDLVMPSGVEPIEYESARPELKMFDAQMALLESREDMADVALMPNFGLFAQGYYGYPGLDMFEGMMNSKWSLNGIIGVRMSWNISSVYTHRIQRRKIENIRNSIGIKRDIFTFNNNLQARQESEEIVRLRAAIKDDDRIVELRGNIRAAAEARLEEGVIDTNDLLAAISEESAARIARSAREVELMKAIYDLKHTLNR